MTHTTTSSDTSRAAQRVATWRREVDAFFGKEWSRLRDLIMLLEEEAWQEHAAPQATDAVPTAPAPESDSNDQERTDDQLAASDDAHSADRLSDIAWQIERRLCTNRPGRK
jgi:hypothetical protein